MIVPPPSLDRYIDTYRRCRERTISIPTRPEVRRVLDESPVREVFRVAPPDSIAAAIDRLLGDADGIHKAREATVEVSRRYHWGVARKELERLYVGLFEEPTE